MSTILKAEIRLLLSADIPCTIGRTHIIINVINIDLSHIDSTHIDDVVTFCTIEMSLLRSPQFVHGCVIQADRVELVFRHKLLNIFRLRWLVA